MRAFCHVGLQKTGTSYLQSHLWDSPVELAAQGVRMVPGDRTRAFRLMQALTAGQGPDREQEVARLRDAVARAGEATLLLSQESLAAADAEAVARLRDCFAEREVHVVVTARDLARQLPSAWQQRVKSRGRITFPDFLEAVRGRRGAGEAFWEQQDLVAVLDRWSVDLPPERVHVVVAPPPGAGAEVLPGLFGDVVGVDFGRLSTQDLRRNVSLDAAQVEMLRRLNDRGRIFETRGAQARMVKQVLAGQVLAPRRQGSLATPVAWADWCREVAAEQVAAVRERGWDVRGSLADLVPGDACFGEVAPVTDAQVADVAIDAVADLLLRLDEAQRTSRKLRGLLDEGVVRDTGLVGKVRRRLGRD